MIRVLAFITVVFVLAVAFVNGWTDAPNSVAACVSTGVLSTKKALVISALADFAGSLTVGLISGKVSERMIDLASYSNDKELYIVSIFSVMLSVVIFSVSAWCFGFPTSESHAMLAGLFGSSVCINEGTVNINYSEWINTVIGLIFSIIMGYVFGYCFTKISFYLLKKDSYIKLKKFQIVSAVLSAYLHGAQDSQKFTGIALSVLTVYYNQNKNSDFKITFLVALIISAGILTSGEKIIKTVGNDLVKLNALQGFSADISGLICLFLSTLCGIPVSTTHIKTSAIMGAGSVNGKINTKTASKLIISWVLTFPVCAIISYILTFIIIK